MHAHPPDGGADLVVSNKMCFKAGHITSPGSMRYIHHINNIYNIIILLYIYIYIYYIYYIPKDVLSIDILQYYTKCPICIAVIGIIIYNYIIYYCVYYKHRKVNCMHLV